MNYRLEILIDKPVDQVVALFEDPDNLGAWQPGFQSWEHLSGEPGQPGEKTRLIYLNGKRRVEMIETLELTDLPREFTATFAASGMVMRVQNLFEVVEDSGGGPKTRWISNNDAELTGFMMRLIGLAMPGCFKKQSRLFMENFKEFAEKDVDLRDSGSVR